MSIFNHINDPESLEAIAERKRIAADTLAAANKTPYGMKIRHEQPACLYRSVINPVTIHGHAKVGTRRIALTPWARGSKPTIPGVYLTRNKTIYPAHTYKVGFSYWTGEAWLSQFDTPALSQEHYECTKGNLEFAVGRASQEKDWRGLSSDPADEKPGVSLSRSQAAHIETVCKQAAASLLGTGLMEQAAAKEKIAERVNRKSKGQQ